MEDQWVIRAEVARRFPDKPWVDIFSKSDMIGGILAKGGRQLPGGVGKTTGSDTATSTAAAVSSTAAEGTAPSPSLIRHPGVDSASTSSLLGQNPTTRDATSAASALTISGPSDFVSQLPGALAVSSLTEEGVSDLKDNLMELLSRHYQAAHQGWSSAEDAANGA